MNLKIIAKSEAGRKAIQGHIDESKKLNFKQKFMVRKIGYVQTVIKNDPLTLLVEIKNPAFQHLLKPEHICREIEEALTKNGAVNDQDYVVEAG